MSDPSWVDVLGFVVAAGGFGFGVYQYREGRIEARRQFAAAAMDSYRNNAQVGAAIQMLDWADRKVWLPPEATAEEGGRDVKVTHQFLAAALALIQNKPNGVFSEEEMLIRDVFDGFVDELEHLANQERAGAFALEDIAPYMAYLADLLFGHRMHLGPDARQALLDFIAEYWGAHVVEFLRRCDGKAR